MAGWMRVVATGLAAVMLLVIAGLTLPSLVGPVRPLAAPRADPVAVQASRRQILEQRLQALAGAFDGKVGIAVQEVDTGWTTGVRLDEAMPQQSVSKVWVTLGILAAADRGELSLDERVAICKADLSIFHQPIRKFVGEGCWSTSLRDLTARAIQESDNAANDALARRLGGPFSVQVGIVNKNLDGVRFGPGERTLQTEAAGLTWKPEYSFERTFWEEREALPQAKRRAALEAYLANPPDGATPRGVADGLARLQRGELLSPTGTAFMLTLMQGTQTGAGRLRGGLPPGWRLAHKTGTGQVIGPLATGFNDVGLMYAPDGRVYAVAVMIASTRAPPEERMAFIASVSRIVGEVYGEGIAPVAR